VNRTAQLLWLTAISLTLAWGAGAFGAVYPWAYIPLMIASAILGLAGAGLGWARVPTSLALSLALLGVAVTVQLVPLKEAYLLKVSPHAVSIVKQHSLAFAVGNAHTHPLSIEPRQTVLGLAFLASFGVLLIGTTRMLSREGARRLAGVITIIGVVLALVGIITNATFNGKIYGFWDLKQGGAPFGPYVNKNHFAGWMLIAIPVAIGYFMAIVSKGMEGRISGLRNLLVWFSTERASIALLSGFAILTMTLSLVLTLSRSGIIAFAGTLLLTAFIAARHQSGLRSRAFSVAYLVFVATIVVSWVGVDQIVSRFAKVDLTDISERPAIWADTITIARDFWLTGTGLNTYGLSTLFYQTSMPGLHLREAHNDYLQLAAEGGLLLGIPVLLTIAAFACGVRRRLNQDVGSIWWIRIGAVMGLAAVAIQSVFDFSLQMPGNAAFFAVTAGLALHDGRKL
jgi:O-antigen ligase